MNIDEKKLIRAIFRKVHPDLFLSNAHELQCNSDSLKVLNAYVDQLSRHKIPVPAKVEFYVKDNSQLKKIEAQLPASGSLKPLFHAFGLISADEVSASDSQLAVQDTNFLEWLHDSVSEAIRTADQHDALKKHIKRYRASIEERYSLESVKVMSDHVISIGEQERHLECLRTLETCLASSGSDNKLFQGLVVQMHHPETCPFDSHFLSSSDGDFKIKTGFMKSYVGDDGCIHLVADPVTLGDQLKTIDLQKARVLAQASALWQRRVRELTPLVTDLLGVQNVWCDTKTEHNCQRFALWAGYLLEKRKEIKSLLGNRKYSFSMIVHSDVQAPLITYNQTSPLLNVRADCPPPHLLDFLLSENGVAASEAAIELEHGRLKEEALLEQVRRAIGAKALIKLCMKEKVLEGAQRLLEHADAINQIVNLRGACIALDDCYQVWDSGFISIPYNFKVSELPGMFRRLQLGTQTNLPLNSSAINASATAGLKPSFAADGLSYSGSAESTSFSASARNISNGISNGRGNGSSAASASSNSSAWNSSNSSSRGNGSGLQSTSVNGSAWNNSKSNGSSQGNGGIVESTSINGSAWNRSDGNNSISGNGNSRENGSVVESTSINGSAWNRSNGNNGSSDNGNSKENGSVTSINGSAGNRSNGNGSSRANGSITGNISVNGSPWSNGNITATGNSSSAESTSINGCPWSTGNDSLGSSSSSTLTNQALAAVPARAPVMRALPARDLISQRPLLQGISSRSSARGWNPPYSRNAASQRSYGIARTSVNHLRSLRAGLSLRLVM